jgi:hypothetical protein
MFNEIDASAEIAASMESNLVSHAIEKREEHINKFAKALDYLNSVAEIFDEIGLNKEAEITTTLLEVIAAKKHKKKQKHKSKSKSKSKGGRSVKSVLKNDPPTEDLTSEKMVENLKHKGWIFNADDFNFGNDHHDSCMCSMCMDYMTRDDTNYDFDVDYNSVYHLPRDKRDDNWTDFDPYEKDEAEQDLARMFHELSEHDFENESYPGEKHQTMLPPPHKKPQKVLHIDDFTPKTKSWRDILETGKETIRPPKKR